MVSFLCVCFFFFLENTNGTSIFPQTRYILIRFVLENILSDGRTRKAKRKIKLLGDFPKRVIQYVEMQHRICTFYIIRTSTYTKRTIIKGQRFFFPFVLCILGKFSASMFNNALFYINLTRVYMPLAYHLLNLFGVFI